LAVEVKEEKFGSRPSVLERFLRESGIHFEKNIFMITCRREFNENTDSRYLILKEFLNPDELESGSLKAISRFLRSIMKDRVLGCCVGEEKDMVSVLYRDRTFTCDRGGFRNFLLRLLSCSFEISSAEGSGRATPLSRFFREDLGKSVSVTDLDFFIPSSGCFVEEKTFARREGNGPEVYIGLGQFISLRELRRDILSPEARVVLVYTPDAHTFYVREFDDEVILRREEVPGWGPGVLVRLDRSLGRAELAGMLRGR